MGIRFQFPTIWLPIENYTPAYNVLGDWWKEFLLLNGFKVPRIEIAREYDLAQLQEAYSL